MVRTVFYALFGAVLGLVLSLVWATLLVQVKELRWPLSHLIWWAGLWILGGLVAGVVATDSWAEDLLARSKGTRLFRQQRVNTIPAPCGWCRGTGRTFYFFRCPVCRGQGHVLAVRPKKKCAWCQGAGRKFLLRCRACGGSGWLSHFTRL
jgi:DnaJ-class molecular chaperone